MHPTAPDATTPIQAPALPPRPQDTAPPADQLNYWITRSQRGELGALQMRAERDAETDARSRNAIPQETCASWYDAEIARQAAEQGRH